MSDDTNDDTNDTEEGGDEPIHYFGHRLINGMGDLRDAAETIMKLTEDRCLEAFWLNTGGKDMRFAIRRGNLKDMPFYMYESYVPSRKALTACSIRYCDWALSVGSSEINAADFIGRLALFPTRPGEPFAEDHPLNWSSSQMCMKRDLLEGTGLLLSEQTKDAAPDCLVLCERRSGLALPVPIGMTLEWRANDRAMDVRTYYIRSLRVSGGADYGDMTKDFDPALLCDEAVETERYLTRLIRLAQDPHFGRQVDLGPVYDTYCDAIAKVRAAHAGAKK